MSLKTSNHQTQVWIRTRIEKNLRNEKLVHRIYVGRYIHTYKIK